MKIVRDGVSYELTPQELREAYEEQEHLYDIEDVKEYLQAMTEDAFVDDEQTFAAQAILTDPGKLADCARIKRRNMDKHGMAWYGATEEAVNEAVAEERNSHRGHEHPKCAICGRTFREGYCFDAGLRYYCSEECLHTDFTPEEWDKECEENEDSYWSTWP